jgi:hypothetical protein
LIKKQFKTSATPPISLERKGTRILRINGKIKKFLNVWVLISNNRNGSWGKEKKMAR